MTQMEARMILEQLNSRVGRLRSDVDNYLVASGKAAPAPEASGRTVKIVATLVWLAGISILIMASAKIF